MRNICVSGFRGHHCDENIDDCPGNLCQNGATCMDRVNEYSCLCPPSFTGPQCELDVDECSVRPSLCHNGATCTNSHGSYSCICVNGWTGPDCSVNIDDCAGAACFNGATCIDRVGSFYCQCTYGKTGKSREVNTSSLVICEEIEIGREKTRRKNIRGLFVLLDTFFLGFVFKRRNYRIIRIFKFNKREF